MSARLIWHVSALRNLTYGFIRKQNFHSSSIKMLDFRERDPRGFWTKRGEKKRESNVKEERKAIVKQGFVFDQLPQDTKTKEAFETALGMFLHKNLNLRGHCEFIYAALRRMEEFNVHEDLSVYKKLIDLFPKKKMVSTNIYQAEYYFFPKQQFCCAAVLKQMEHYSVYPDKELYDLVIGRFGGWAHISRKMKSMMYWMPKLKHINPFPYPRPLPRSDIELAKLAIKQICRDPANLIQVWFTEALENPPEDTWIVSGQSPLQKDHIKEHPSTEPLYVDGPFRVWVGGKNVQYFMLSAEPKKNKFYADIKDKEEYSEEEWANWESKYTKEFPESRRQLMLMPTIHEQPEGTILALSISGTNSKESMSCWINFLQKQNPKLSELLIVFRIGSVNKELMPIEDATRFKCSSNMLETIPS